MLKIKIESYNLMTKINLWFKVRAGETNFSLTDFPELISYRWTYFRDRWEFINNKYIALIPDYELPDALRVQIEDMGDFIEAMRHVSSNPFRRQDILFRFYSVFDNTKISDLPLTPDETKMVNSKLKSIRELKRDDFIDMRTQLVNLRDQFADAKGLTDDTYNSIYHRSARPQQTKANNDDMNFMLELVGSIKNLDFLLANEFNIAPSFIDPYAQARINANNDAVNIETYQAGYLVNLPYGQDLRGLARLYMGDEEKWIEIAIANGLKPPYIDEVGQRLAIVANGMNNLITLPAFDEDGFDVSEKLFVNQIVFIQSDTLPTPDQRVIMDIRRVPVSGELLVELSGEPDLNKYKLDDNAYLRVFKPQTINSSLKVLIPTQDANTDDRHDVVPWFLSASPEDAKRQKVDLKLDDNGDLSFTGFSDINLSYGYDNAIQAIRLKFQTKVGELFRHPSYGLSDVVGIKTDDLATLAQTLSDSIAANITADPRFDRIETLNLEYSVSKETPDMAAGFHVALVVRLAGTNQTIPISFTINI